jgi:autotransporter-associated beta strand protein
VWRLDGAVRFWTGAGGTDANWSNSGNWSGGVLPVNGDDLVFNAVLNNLDNTNNLLTTVNSITLLGPSYKLRGNPLIVTNGISGQQAPGNNFIELNVTLGAAQTFDCLNAGSGQFFEGGITNGGFLLTFGGSGNITANATIAGAGGVTKTGSGSLTYQTGGNNTYTGPTRVNAGTLLLNVSGTSAVGPALVIGDGSGTGSPTVRWLQGSEIVDTAYITNNVNGLMDLNGYSEAVGPITISGGQITTGAGTLLTSADMLVQTSTVPASISGNITFVGGLRTITVDNGVAFHSIDISASVGDTGSGLQIVNGTTPGAWLGLQGSNWFTGPLTISGLTVSAESPFALGATNGGTFIQNSGRLFLYHSGFTNESLTLAGGTIFEAELNCTWNGPINLTGDTTFQNFASPGLFDIQGQITGTGNVTMIAPSGSTNRYSGTNYNNYVGKTILQSGYFEFGRTPILDSATLGDVQIGDPAGGVASLRYLAPNQIPNNATITMYANCVLDLNSYWDGIGSLIMYGATVNIGSGFLDMYAPGIIKSLYPAPTGALISGIIRLQSSSTVTVSNVLTFAGEVRGTGGLTKTGPSHLYLTASNSYSGLTVVQQGYLWAESPWALGDPSTGTIVSNSASLVMMGKFGITNESLTLNGPGPISYGALDSETVGTNIWAGPIVINADTTLAPYPAGGNLRLLGPISGPGGFTEISGGGTNALLWLEGGLSNSYGGTTVVVSGALNLAKTTFDGAIPHDLFINSATAVHLLGNNQIYNGADVYVASGGLFDLNGVYDYIDTLRGSGLVSFGSLGSLGVGQNNGSSKFDGMIVGAPVPAGWQLGKFGSGTITLTGNNTYNGDTHIFNGTLVVNGSQPLSTAYVESGATLGGSGTVGDIDSLGTVAPGSSPGILTCSNLTFTSSGTYNAQLSGRTAGSGYDQINVRGAVNLANATLNPAFAFTSPVSVGDQLIIINNDGADPVVGNFIGWPEGTNFMTTAGYKLGLTYVGGDGNDVAFNVLQIPGGSISSSVTAGNGNHAVDPNDCNNLSIVITNTTATKMTNVTAVLSTTTVGAAVTQPYSSFPDIPPNGTATNKSPFQLSSFPGMICGTNINLQLSVFSASHGAFAFPLGFASGEPTVLSNRYDVNAITNIPDVGSIESTNVVSGFVGPLSKVVVSLWLTHPVDSDLTMMLLAPNGSGITLTAGNGSGANFGSACSPDGSRTTFDDSAATSITAGSPPFVGSYRPQYSLSGLTESPANGNWRLRITDSFAGSLGALRCWSLALYGYTCAAGSGACAPCLPPVSGVITTNNLSQTNRLFVDRVVAACGLPKALPAAVAGSYHYNLYGYTNTSGADACVTVMLSAPACNVQATAYLDNFDYSNIANNYLGDSGYSTGVAPGNMTSFSVTVPAGHTVIVVVNEGSPGAGCAAGYTLALSGLPCPPPLLNVQSLPPTQARLFWTNSAGGYLLESTPVIGPTTWTGVPEEPLVSGGNYNVTNTTSGPSKFYRLHKP